MAIPVWLEAASAAGQAAGGVATVAGVAFAVWSLNNWKRQERGAARARAAADLLPPALAYCHEVWVWASYLLIAHLDAEKLAREGKQAAAMDAVRSAAPKEERLRAVEKELRNAQMRAIPHLTKGEQQVISAAEGLRREIDRFWFRYEIGFTASFIRGREPRLATEVVLEEFEERRIALEAIKERIEIVLSHISRHEDPPDLPPLEVAQRSEKATSGTTTEADARKGA